MVFTLSPEQQALRDGVRQLLSERFPLEQLPVRSTQGMKLLAECVEVLKELGVSEYFSSPESSVVDLTLLSQECGFALAPGHPALTLLHGPYAFSRLSDMERGAVEGVLGKEGIEKVLSGAGAVFASWSAPTTVGTFGYAVQLPLARLHLGESLSLRVAPSSLSAQDGFDLLSPIISDCGPAEGTPALLTENTASRIRSLQAVLLAAELAGISERVVTMTREYVAGREQFGVPVALFQGVAHPLADMFSQSEALSALVLFAAWSADSSPDQLPLSACAALRYGCEVAPRIVERAIQLHGGIGFTWEFPLHLFLRRAKSIAELHCPLDAEMIAAGEAQS